jgi:hypothetical protein
MDAAAARPDENAGGASERGSLAVADSATAARVVSFRAKSTYRSDPEYSASGIRQYVNDQLYPHLLAAMQAINATQPLHPVLFMARCLLEGSVPDDEPTAGARQTMRGFQTACIRLSKLRGSTHGAKLLRCVVQLLVLGAACLQTCHFSAIRFRGRSRMRSRHASRRTRDRPIQYVYGTSCQHAGPVRN